MASIEKGRAVDQHQIVVVGLGRFGTLVATTLHRMGHEVMAIDNDEQAVQQVMGEVTYPVTADATNDSTLRDLGVQEFDVGIVAIGSNIEASIMVAVLFKTLGLNTVVARARNPLHGNTLERIGCDRVIHAELESGRRLAHSLFYTHAEEYMELGENYGISRLKVPPHLEGLTLQEAGFSGLRDKSSVAVVALRRSSSVTLIPDMHEELNKSDVLFVAGADAEVNVLISQSRATSQ